MKSDLLPALYAADTVNVVSILSLLLYFRSYIGKWTFDGTHDAGIAS